MAANDWTERIIDRLPAVPLVRPRLPESLPVVLNRKRIYVLPTPFGLFIACLLITMLLGALNYNNNPGVLLAFVLGAIANNSLISAHMRLSGLEVFSIQAQSVHAGANLSLAIKCRNQGKVRARDGLEWSPPADADAFADEQTQDGELNISIATNRRGLIKLPKLRLSTVRPFGLARAWSWIWPNQHVMIWPRIEQNGPPLPHNYHISGGRLTLRSSMEEPHHLREYRRGDPQRLIAWKSSAKRGELMVREYESGIPREISLDWHQLPMLDYEAKISRLTHWVILAEQRGLNFSLNLPDGLIGPSQGASHLQNCLDRLAALPNER